jgi:hypothetical protein
MTQDNPFAKLGALDQQLYQETTQKPESPEDELVAKPSVAKEKDSTSLLANQQTSKSTKKQTSKSVNQFASKLANQQTSKSALTTKEKKKYGSYLREDSILSIQVLAVQTKRNDHEVLQEIVDFYFANKKT